jgi:uncharacterized protein YjiK
MTLRNSLQIQIYIAAIGLIYCLTGCQDRKTNSNGVSTSQNIKLLNIYSLTVHEPSGLTLAKDNLSLWTVSDTDGHIYQIDLEGTTLAHFPTGYHDLEAITTIDDQLIAFIAERERKIVIATQEGQILQEATIDIPGFDNRGPEALTYDEEAAEFHLMQEAPGLLLTLNRQLEEVDRQELKFAQDYSSISFDSDSKHLWVLSDQSKNIHVLDQNSSILESFSVDVEQMEGLAVDHNHNRIYIISDPLEELYVFEFETIDQP